MHESRGEKSFDYCYDANGQLYAVYYQASAEASPSTYYFSHNWRGDIIGIYNTLGTQMATYEYDVWGNVISVTNASGSEITDENHIANLNPFRYRGYVYDAETGLYYLQSRYYDPVTGRFLNADIYCDTQSNILGTNMFTYCNNNPVNQIDPEGTNAIWLQFTEAVNGLGHTSLMVQDDYGAWWYFYWSDKHIIFRPCVTKNFTLQQVNSYLNGFDSRPGNNFYVKSFNAIHKTEFYDPNQDIVNITGDEKYYLSIRDGMATTSYIMQGDFVESYNFLYNLTISTYAENYQFVNNIGEYVYENGEKIFIYHVCNKQYRTIKYYDVTGCYVSRNFYYYDNITSSVIFSINGYNIAVRNCVQVSMVALLKGTFSIDDSGKKSKIFSLLWTNSPNVVFSLLSTDFKKLSLYYYVINY